MPARRRGEACDGSAKERRHTPNPTASSGNAPSPYNGTVTGTWRRELSFETGNFERVDWNDIAQGLRRRDPRALETLYGEVAAKAFGLAFRISVTGPPLRTFYKRCSLPSGRTRNALIRGGEESTRSS